MKIGRDLLSFVKLHGTEKMRIRLASQTTNRKELLALAGDPSWAVTTAVLGNRNAQSDYEVLAILERHHGDHIKDLPKVKELITNAQNTKSLQILSDLAANPLYCVRYAAFSNSKIIELARTTTSPEVLRNLITKSVKNAIDKTTFEVIKEVISRQITPIDVFEMLANDLIVEVGEVTMESPYAPPPVVAKLINKFIEKKGYGGHWSPGPIVWVDDSCNDYQMPDQFCYEGYKYTDGDIKRVQTILASHSKGKEPILEALKTLNAELHLLLTENA